MPHYDETFIHDDNQNQRKNKRSYRVYKNGLNPLRFLESGDVLHALEEKGTSAIKQNIRNIKHRNARFKPDSTNLETNSGRPAKDGPDIILDHCPRLRPPNFDVHYKKNCLAPCKSFDNLIVTNSNKNHVKFKLLRNGSSLQNLRHEESLQHYASPLEDRLATNRKSGDARNSYSVVDARRRNAQRRLSRATPPPGVGVYRQISNDGSIIKKNENEAYGDSGSGHRGSLRGANKLARRARSFKDDLLERLSNMRSPAQHPPHLSSAIRSHSPLSPKLRTGTKSVTSEEGEVTPAKELERLVKEVTFGLKHFSDVITKRKLEMLPDNGTIVFESIANIHKAIKPYCGRSPQLVGAVKRLCTVLATLIRLCDEITGVNLRSKLAHEGLDESAPALAPAHVASVVEDVTLAVHEVASLAQQHMTRPALAPRPALVSPRASTQRNSLPDIPLTPKERSLLTGEGGAETNGVRASHSSESVLDAPDSPPPKPARPNRKMELAPPLPPKRKSANDNSLIALSIDRLSLQSHSSGSLDSMLNVSNDDSHLSANHDSVFITPTGADLIATCSCGGESRACADPHDAQAHHNHNRFSNESGFVSVGHSEISSEHNFTSSFSAHHYSSHADSTFDSTDCFTEMKSTLQSFESRNVFNVNSVTTHYSVNANRLASITSDESETPPELPVKTRRNVRAELCHQFPAVEIRHPMCSLHNEVRPHTLADNSTRPPPLPLKKKHIMAYMEMFGNCSHPPAAGAVAPPDLFRHSIHTYNLASSQHTSAGAMSIQQHQQVQRSIAQSFTVQHFGTPPLSGSDDSVSITTSSGTSPVPPEPPALPPKMKKNKQNAPLDLSNELVPPASPRPSSHNSVTDEAVFNNLSIGDDSLTGAASPAKFPLEEELKMLAPQPTPSPVPSHKSEGAAEGEPATSESDDIILKTDISAWLLLKAPTKDGPEVRGGHPDALIVLATKATKDFAYQEAFLATYRTWVRPDDLVARLVRRAHYHRPRPHELRCTLGLLTRIVADLTTTDLEEALMREIMDFIYWLVEIEELPIAKALRQILVEKQNQVYVQACGRPEYETPCLGPVSLRRDTLLDFKASELAEQMTLLDAALFARISTAEVLSWPRDQSEDSSPNLTRFTEHFNKMSYWARSRILEQDEARRREGLAARLLKVMKRLRKLNNFNSYLALVSALDSPPVRRLGWPRALLDALHDHCAIIDSSSSFRAYRQALADTHPPCIPYIGLVLQDLTFVHIGNPDLLPDGSINFTKRWQQYHIMENMKRFQKEQYKFKRNDRIQAMFNDFNDVLSEETMWQISESIKPRGGRRTAPTAATAPTPAPAQTAA